MFVKEVRLPTGEIYEADSILYHVMGIQEYLNEHGRYILIFRDPSYDTFTTALHEVIKGFKLPTNEMGTPMTRILEEHLWEAKHLGSHSPMVSLLSYIMINKWTMHKPRS